MSEPRKNHLAIDGAQVKEDEDIGTYKPIADSETELRPTKVNLGKSKERVSSDGAEEKLIQKEDEAKICTRVDMADAKYVVGDHRNGDAKIELDANKRQFSGLTKEELMQYADDPFWVRLRWFMFVLFWVLWLCMLVGAVVIIVQAPKCAAPTPKTWYEKGPLVDSSLDPIEKVSKSLPALKTAGVKAVFVSAPAYEVLEDDAETAMATVQNLIKQAREFGVQVIVDLKANFVPTTHRWFQLSRNSSEQFADYFVWAKGNGFDANGTTSKPPSELVSKANTPAWHYDETRKEYYLALEGQEPNLNMHNPDVVGKFDLVLKTWMKAGAGGVRLVSAREMLFNETLLRAGNTDIARSDPGVVHTEYKFWRNQLADHPDLGPVLQRWGNIVSAEALEKSEPPVFTLLEDGSLPPLPPRTNVTLSPPAAAPLSADGPSEGLVKLLEKATRGRWPLLHLQSEVAPEEVATCAMVLPATPLLTLDQVQDEGGENSTSMSWWYTTRDSDASVAHGRTLLAAPHGGNATVLLIARWKLGHSGVACVWNPHSELVEVDVSSAESLPAELTFHHASARAMEAANITNSKHVFASNAVPVPARSALLLSYVPKKGEEQ